MMEKRITIKELKSLVRQTIKDVNKIKQINTKIAEALKKIGLDEGVEISLGGTRYSDVKYEVKVTVTELGADGKAKLPMDAYLNIKLSLSDMPNFPTYDEVANKVIMHGQQKLRIVGFNGKKRQSPIILQDENGGKYATGLSNFRQSFEK